MDTAQPDQNHALIAARHRASLSQDELVKACRAAGWTSFDQRMLQRYESGHVRRPHQSSQRILAQVLGVRADELGFSGPTFAQAKHLTSPLAASDPDASAGDHIPDGQPLALEGLEEMRRRTFTLGMAAATASTLPATRSLADPSEALRHALTGKAARKSDGGELDEWQAILHEYALRHLVTPPADLLPGYLTDLGQLNLVLASPPKTTANALYGVSAILTALTAWTYGNLGSPEHSGRWWRTAGHLAASAEDAQVSVWIGAQQAIMAMYQPNASPEAILAHVMRFEPMARALPACTASAWFYCAKAQALALVRQSKSTRLALDELRACFDGLPDGVTSDRASFLGWPETRLHYTESFAFSELGVFEAASAAQDAAMASFPQQVRRDPTKLQLQRALCLTRSGAVAEGERHALATISQLDTSQHDLPVTNLALKVLKALPAGRRSGEAQELRQYVANRLPEMTAL